MACQSYSIRWSSSLTTVCSGGGTSAGWSVNKAGANPAVGEFFAGNSTCSSGISVGGLATFYVKIDGVPALSSVLYTVDGTNSANNGKILSIGTCPSITPSKTPSKTPSTTPSYTPTNTPSVTPSVTGIGCGRLVNPDFELFNPAPFGCGSLPPLSPPGSGFYDAECIP